MPNFERYTNIYVTGDQAMALLERNGVTDENRPEVNERGEILLVSFTGEDRLAVSAVGEIRIQYGVADQGDDFLGNPIVSHEVTLNVVDATALQGQNYKRKERRIHINKLERQGRQKVRRGVALVVRTTVPTAVFEKR